MQRLRVTVALVSESGQLTEEQLQARRDEVLTYLRQRGLITAGDEVTGQIANADRIIRAVLGDQGGFKITVFDTPAVASALAGQRNYSRGSLWSGPDPFFDSGLSYRSGSEFGYRPYQPNEVPRSRNPHAPVPDQPRTSPPRHDPPRHTPPPRSDDTPRPRPPDDRRDTPPPTYTPPPPRSDPPPSPPAREDRRDDDRLHPAK